MDYNSGMSSWRPSFLWSGNAGYAAQGVYFLLYQAITQSPPADTLMETIAVFLITILVLMDARSLERWDKK